MKTYFEEISSSSEDECSRSPIIFLHGIILSGKVWKNVAPEIAKKTGRKAYVLDARNHGRSMWSDKLNIDLLTADLTEFMDEHSIKRAVIVGNSMGGRTAINFALQYPHRVEALVIEDMTPKNVKSDSRAFVGKVVEVVLEQLASYPPEMGLEEIKQNIVSSILTFLHPVLLDKEKFAKHFDMEMVPLVKEGDNIRLESNIDAVLDALKSNFLVQDLPRRNLVFTGDALFIYGSKGFFNIGNDPSVKTLFPNAVIKKVEGASHCIHLDSPKEYAEIVSEFILHKNKHLSKY